MVRESEPATPRALNTALWANGLQEQLQERRFGSLPRGTRERRSSAGRKQRCLVAASPYFVRDFAE